MKIDKGPADIAGPLGVLQQRSQILIEQAKLVALTNPARVREV